MSLIGIDVGSSATKAAAYGRDGRLLASARQVVSQRRDQPGWWEVDPEEVWEAAQNVLRRVATAAPVLRDPPEALAISASGREAFPVGPDGSVLGPCIMAGDTRGEELEIAVSRQRRAEEWVRACGHQPERMDPALRLLWWREARPDVMARARYFLGWHEFLTLRLGGLPITDKSLAGKWLCYDLSTESWSDQVLDELGIERSLLPEIRGWGTAELTLKASVAGELGLPAGLRIATGAFDACCAALGAGASEAGVAGLLCGSWEGLVVPTAAPADAYALTTHGMSLGPHPGAAGLAVFALSPNGTVVVDWARELTGIRVEELDSRLQKSGPGPSPVLAVPHLSGATAPWANGRSSRGLLTELTLATSATDLVKALMEGIAYDLSLALRLLDARGIPVQVLRVAGGGARSAWWMQLKSDLAGLRLEVADMAEPGTYGAARLAGSALGMWGVGEVAPLPEAGIRRHEPNPERASLYAQRLAAYRAAVSDLMGAGWRKPASGGAD